MTSSSTSILARPVSAFGAMLLAACTGVPAGPLDHVSAIETLRGEMRRMDVLMYERTMTELEIDRYRLRRAEEIARAARRLADTALELAADEAALPDPGQRARFISNAEALATEADTLGELAAQGRYEQLTAQLERVGHACAACHAEFRPPAGR